MEVTGILKKVYDVEPNDKDRKWDKKAFSIVQKGEYPKDAAFWLTGDKMGKIDEFQIGDEIKVCYNIESFEFKGKPATSLKAWKIEKIG